MSTKAPAIRRYDDSVAAVTFDRGYGAPRYAVALHGEIIYLYLDTPTTTVADNMRDVPEGSQFLVGFEDATDNWWWGELGGAPTQEDAEALLVSMADGKPGKAFIVPTPSA